MKKPLVCCVLFCFCFLRFSYDGAMRVGYAYQQSSRVGASVNSNAVFPLPNACSSGPTPQWRIAVTLTESAGVAARLKQMNIFFYDDNGVYGKTSTVEGDQLSSVFRVCGSDGVTIPARGRLCGDFCVDLNGRNSGAVALSFVIEDDSGRPNGACTDGIVLLAAKSNQGADLSITNVVSTYNFSPKVSFDFVSPGFVFLHKIVVNNNGPQTANNVFVSDIIESGATFHAVVVERGQYSAPPVGQGGTFSCSLGSVPPGTQVTIWLFLKAERLMEGFVYNNIAHVGSSTDDPDQDNNFAEGAVAPTSSSATIPGRVSITTSSATSNAALGSRLTYTIKVANTGAQDVKVSLANILPAGTTFASAEGPVFDNPLPGGTGVVLSFLLLQANKSANIAITVNVLGGTGPVLGDISNNILFEGAARMKIISACTGIPLERSGELPSPDTILPAGPISIGGGGIITLTWGLPSPSGGDPTPAPRGLSLGAGALSTGHSSEETVSLPASLSADIEPSAEPCTLIGYKLYIASSPSVVNQSNVWKMLPPDVTASTAPRAPAGSYYALVAMYRCPDGTIRDSQPSNEISAGASLSITPPPFREGKHLIVQGQGFAEGAKIIRNGEQLKTIFESGTRLKGKKAGKNAVSGDRIQVRNPNGSLSNIVNYP